MDDSSVPWQLREELDVIFTNLQKRTEIDSNLPKESCKPNKAKLPDWESQINSETSSSTPARGALWIKNMDCLAPFSSGHKEIKDKLWL